MSTREGAPVWAPSRTSSSISAAHRRWRSGRFQPPAPSASARSAHEQQRSQSIFKRLHFFVLTVGGWSPLLTLRQAGAERVRQRKAGAVVARAAPGWRAPREDRHPRRRVRRRAQWLPPPQEGHAWCCLLQWMYDNHYDRNHIGALPSPASAAMAIRTTKFPVTT